MKKLLVGLLIVAAVVAAVLLSNRATALGRLAWRGKAVQAVPGSVVVEAEYTMALKSEVSGRMTESKLDPGASFATGDFLLQIDSSDLELEIDRIQGEYEAAKAVVEVGSAIQLELATAREKLVQAKAQVDNGSLTEREYRQQERGVEQIEQKLKLEKVSNDLRLANLRNSLEQKRRELSKMRITAPFDCVVKEVYAPPGELISAGNPIALLISTGRTVEARISEENFSNLKEGQVATVRLLGYGSQQFDAKVSKVLPSADAETQRYIVHLKVDIALDRLLPGLTGEASIVTAVRENTLLIPRRALIGDKVLVVNDGVVAIRSVQKGYESLDQAEIVSGLSEGEFVITEELDRFREGDRVRAEERK